MTPLRARQVVLALREVHVVHLHCQLDVVNLHRVVCAGEQRQQGYKRISLYTRLRTAVNMFRSLACARESVKL